MGWFLFEWELHLRTIFCEWWYYSGDKDGIVAPLFSQVNKFDGEKEEWCQYVDWLDHFFEANEVANVNKKRAILLKMIGPSAYKLLCNLLAPAKLTQNWWAFSKYITVQNHQRRCTHFVLIHGFVRQRSQYLPSCRSYAVLPNFAILHSTRGHAKRLIGVWHQR